MAFQPVEDFFVDEFTSAATYVTAAGVDIPLLVILDNKDQTKTVGESSYIDGRPTALCKSFTIPDAKKGDTLRIHDTLTDTDGDDIVDDAGNEIIASSVLLYYVQEVLRDESGMTELVLSEDAD